MGREVVCSLVLDGGGETADYVRLKTATAGELLVDARADALQNLLEETFGALQGALVAIGHSGSIPSGPVPMGPKLLQGCGAS